MRAERARSGWLLGRLALQNLGRRRARTLLLVAAVAIGTGVVFAGATLMRSIEASMAVGFTRLGADLMVVPADALTNITAALLTVEPTTLTLDAAALDRAGVASVGRSAPQRIYRASRSGIGGDHATVDLIGFDPARDFTVLPWVDERLGRPMQPGDVIVGARRDLPLGSEVAIFGRPHRVWGRLGRTGVGTHELGVFLTMDDFLALGAAVAGDGGHDGGHGDAHGSGHGDAHGSGHGSGHGGAAEGDGGDGLPEVFRPDRVSGFLVELAPGATELQARFGLLSALPEVKVVAGESMLTGIRQGLAALLDGILALMALTAASTALMVGVLFSAIVTERRAELGLLKAIGARRGQIVGMMLGEAAVATGIGGAAGVVLGILVLRLYERSLVAHLDRVGVPFLWLDTPTIVLFAIACILAAAAVGALGALVPAWRAGRRDPYELIRAEG